MSKSSRSWAREHARRLRKWRKYQLNAFRVAKRETVMVVDRDRCHEEYVTIAQPSGRWWRMRVRYERDGSCQSIMIFDAVADVSDELRLFMGGTRDTERAVTKLLEQWNGARPR